MSAAMFIFFAETNKLIPKLIYRYRKTCIKESHLDKEKQSGRTHTWNLKVCDKAVIISIVWY